MTLQTNLHDVIMTYDMTTLRKQGYPNFCQLELMEYVFFITRCDSFIKTRTRCTKCTR